MIERVVLITNLLWCKIHDITLEAHALLIEPADDVGGPRVRGFLTAGTLPVFSMRVGGYLHAIRTESDGSKMELCFRSGETFKLDRHETTLPIDIEHFDADEHNEIYEHIWGSLATKVARYWPEGRWMPRAVFGPADR